MATWRVMLLCSFRSCGNGLSYSMYYVLQLTCVRNIVFQYAVFPSGSVASLARCYTWVEQLPLMKSEMCGSCYGPARHLTDFLRLVADIGRISAERTTLLSAHGHHTATLFWTEKLRALALGSGSEEQCRPNRYGPERVKT